MFYARLVATVIAVSVLLNAPSAAAEPDACTVPGVNVLSDAPGDQTGAAVVPADYDLRSVAISEALTPPISQSTLFMADGKRRLIFTYKVGDLSNLPPMTRWLFFFNGPSTTARKTFFVGMTNFPDEGTKFIYGAEPTLNGTTGFEDLGVAEPGSNFNVDGTITIVVPLDKFAFAPGASLDTFKANVVQSIGAGSAGYLAGPIVDSGTGAGSYTVVATNACGTEGGGNAATVRAANPSDAAFKIHAAPASLNDLLLGASEPTLDINYKTGDVFYRFTLGTARVSNFNETTGAATWADASDLVSSLVGLDPFLGGGYKLTPDGTPDGETDSRIFTLQLLAATSAMSYSDDNGETWVPAQGGGEPMVVDNQSIGAGPYPENFPLDPILSALGPGYAVYYCGHTFVNAFCSRSDDGGQTFAPPTPIFPVDGLCNNHGHVKVGADGTVYVPINNTCLGTEGVTLSTDGGITWNYVSVPNTVLGRWDPSIAIARDGTTVYFAYAEEGTDEAMVIKGTLQKGPIPTIAWDEDNVANLSRIAGLTLNNIVFSTAVAGDADRAAVIFHGTTKEGDSGDTASMTASPIAVWHLYAAMTYDGGRTWGLRNLTPGDPTQKGAICDNGTTCPSNPNDRNLLDFMDAVIDGQGRIVVSFADGCTGNCVSSDVPSYSSDAVIARQSGGRRMYAAFDPPPAAPTLAAAVAGDGQVTLDWNDVAGATGYKVFQSNVSGGQGSVPVVSPTASMTTLTGLLNGTTYFFTVKAVSAAGDSATSNEVSATPSAGPVELTATLAATSYSKTADAQGRYPVSAGSPLTVGFTVSTSGGDASAKRYYMNFGDGTEVGPQSSPTFTHDYAKASGSEGYRAYAIVTQNNGTVSSTSNEVAIKTFTTVVVEEGDGTPADAQMTFEFTDGNVAPATVRFTTTGSTGTSYVLDFGDGDSPATPNQITGNGAPAGIVTHTYNLPGTYTAKLTMTGDEAPTRDDVTLTITVVAQQQLTAQLSVSPSTVVAGDAETPVTMDASQTVPDNGKTIDDYTYTFDFGDGTVIGPGTETTAQHVYTTAGTYELVLTVTEAVQAPAAKSGSAAKSATAGPATSVARSQVVVKSATKAETPRRGSGALNLWLLIPMLLLGAKRIRRYRS